MKKFTFDHTVKASFMFNACDHQVAIVDYGMGNLFNVQRACSRVGINGIITNDKNVITVSHGMILPGVGAFGNAMNNLRKLDLIGVIKDHIGLNKPFLGICLGLQLLLTDSQEFGGHKGLDVIKGHVLKFKNTDDKGRCVKVPQVGWNQIFFQNDNDLLEGVDNGQYMYFVHSYYVQTQDSCVVLTSTRYGDTQYCSAVLKGSIFAMQFHPEKSGMEGLKIYKNWAKKVHHNKELREHESTV